MIRMRLSGSLSVRFALAVLVGGLLLGLAAAALMIVADYRAQVRDTRMVIDDFMRQSVLPLSQLMRADRTGNALFLVESLANSPWIERCSVEAADGTLLLDRQEYSTATLPWWLPDPFPEPLRLTLDAQVAGLPLVLAVRVDRVRVMAPFIERAYSILQACLLAGLVAPLLVVALMRAFVTGYLRRIIQTFDAINPAQLAAVRLPVHPAHRYDELGELERVGNRLLHEMHELMESRKAMADALFDSERRLRQLMDALPHMVFARDASGRFVYANHCYAMTLGKTVAQVEGYTLAELHPQLQPAEVDARLEADRRVIASGEEDITPEETIVDHFGVERTCRTIRVPLHYPDRTIALVVSMDITDQKMAETRLRHMAFHDALTGLPNRIGLMQALDRELARARRSGQYGALLFIDLDGFKAVNDRMGHQQGDVLLQQLAQRLTGHVREGDLAARLAGDEFVILVPELGATRRQALQAAARIAETLREGLAQPFRIDGETAKVTASIGAVLFPEAAQDGHGLVSRADSAMYRAKIEGKNAVVFFGEEEAAAGRRLAHLREDLPLALEREQLVLLFVPQVDLQGRITGAEALLRWQHPQEGLVLPRTFLPLMESTGVILPVGDWVWHTACTCLQRWRQQGLWRDGMALGINVSARELMRSHLTQRLETMVEEHGLPPQCLALEVHEGALLEHGDELLLPMQLLRQAGFRLVLDDFGAGYFSLSDLARLPIDSLKADPSLIQHPTGERPRALFRGLVSLTRQLGLDMVAEGVEHRAQLDFLDSVDCRQCQGYYFGVPMPAADFAVLLAEGRVIVRH